MKNVKNKIFVGILSLAIIFSNILGTGAIVADAADTEYQYNLNVVVVDEEDNEVANVPLMLASEDGSDFDEYFEAVTDASGRAVYEVNGNEMGTYVLQPGAESGYTCLLYTSPSPRDS